ncbi:MAG: HD domain-containing protein [Solitalea sp.]
MTQNKKKIINDPVYGFISIPYDIIFDLLSHPYLQRLRRIKQMALAHLVYPGALHTRLHHALGAMHLMCMALETLRGKGHRITEEEAEAAAIAILLHDAGHGPFSHALEHTIVEGVSHEDISAHIMDRLNEEFGGRLSLAIRIFKGTHKKKFLHQLVSGQLDMDRMDYLNRDSFYSGVSEGVIGFDRIIKMLNVKDDQLVVEEKGIYSIEKFLVARRLMYWQVYLHKTVVVAEQMLIKALHRARKLALEGESLFSTSAFGFFLHHRVSREEFLSDPQYLDAFLQLDDHDITVSVKAWAQHPDRVLSFLCGGLINRQLLRIEIQKSMPSKQRIAELRRACAKTMDLSGPETEWLVFRGKLRNSAYRETSENIDILIKDGSLADITDASDNFNIKALSKPVEKHYCCYPKQLFTG